MTDTVTLFLALLAVVAQATVALAAILAIASRFSPAARRTGRALGEAIAPYALFFAFCVAAIAMAGSLYFSEAAHFLPCKLCWYQRIAMYPLVPILAIAAWRRDRDVSWYVVPVALLGGAISTYHVLLERFPSLETGACDPNNPCSLIWVERFGYQTIPVMALSAFALIVVLVLAARADHDEEEID
ncbi:MAG TPA: disulfide bond formation protein B [Acidimicrobiales bacterium]|nr:disulfide bond formation protein B [Acidimicrobiales bacterium]